MKQTVFLTLVSSFWVDKIVANMFKLGLGVAPAAPSGYVLDGGPDHTSAFLAMIVESPLNSSDLGNAVRALLNGLDIKYYSIVIGPLTGTENYTLIGTNISVSKMREEASERAKKRSVPYLKLVKKEPAPSPPEEGPDTTA